MEIQYLLDAFARESRLISHELRQHPRLGSLFPDHSQDVDAGALRDNYLLFLKMHADYVQYSAPALRSAGLAMRDGDEEDQRWSAVLLGYADGEMDLEQDYGHEVWARDDMLALGAGPELLNAPAWAGADHYGAYFVDEAAAHPYAILGAKGVLEHVAITVADDVVKVVTSGIPGGEQAVRFAHEHGTLDIEHVREGDQNLAKLQDPQKRFQVLQGAYFTSGVYRSILQDLVPGR